MAVPLVSKGMVDPMARLTGSDDDPEDNVQKELLIMQAGSLRGKKHTMCMHRKEAIHNQNISNTYICCVHSMIMLLLPVLASKILLFFYKMYI